MRRILSKVWAFLGHAFLLRDIVAFLSPQGFVASVLAIGGSVVAEEITNNAAFILYGLWCVGLIVLTAKWDAITYRWRSRRKRQELKAARREAAEARTERRIAEARLIAGRDRLVSSIFGNRTNNEGDTDEEK